MKKPISVAAGLLFALRGTGVLRDSSMSGTTFGTGAGPVVIVIVLAVATIGCSGACALCTPVDPLRDHG